MFDIGFSELLLVGLVALVVLGPERLPGAIRTTSLWLGRLKRSVQGLRSEIEREIGADDIRRQLHNERILELEREMRELRESFRLDSPPPPAHPEPPVPPQPVPPPPSTARKPEQP